MFCHYVISCRIRASLQHCWVNFVKCCETCSVSVYIKLMLTKFSFLPHLLNGKTKVKKETQKSYRSDLKINMTAWMTEWHLSLVWKDQIDSHSQKRKGEIRDPEAKVFHWTCKGFAHTCTLLTHSISGHEDDILEFLPGLSKLQTELPLPSGSAATRTQTTVSKNAINYR